MIDSGNKFKTTTPCYSCSRKRKLSALLSLMINQKMEGNIVYDDKFEITPCGPNHDRTLVLVGRTGNGKSATGNSIIGKEAFKSKSSSSIVTHNCELQHTYYDGKIIKVIDTPGLFDFSKDSDLVMKEIGRCIHMAKDGIHAVLAVFSVRTGFSREEVEVLKSVYRFFGKKLRNYMIFVFTGGDDLEENEETLDDYLGLDYAEPLKKILWLCENRKLLFDNKTKDKRKKDSQLTQLFSLVNTVVDQNCGKPYTEKIFSEWKEGGFQRYNQAALRKKISVWKDEWLQFHHYQVKRNNEMVKTELREYVRISEEKLAKEKEASLELLSRITESRERYNDGIPKLKEKLKREQEETKKLREEAKEQEACLEALRSAREAQEKSNDEIRELREDLERAREETEMLRKDAKERGCSIM